jgi:nucleotide-binding universal stress UspA family protein
VGRGTIETVLLGADASEEFALVAGFAAGLRGAGVKRVVVGHVLDASGVEGPVVAASADAMRETLAERAAPVRNAGLEVEVRIGTGETTAALLRMAQEANVDAVVSGTHRKSLVDRLAIGSVSEALATSASIPVILVPYSILEAAEDPAAVAAGMGECVLVPTDFSAAAGRALERACALASHAGGLVRLIAVVPDNGRPTPALEDLSTRCKARGVRTSFVRREGDPAAEVVAEGHAAKITSIVMGTRGRTAVGEALLGSVSMSVVREAEWPVMIVP